MLIGINTPSLVHGDMTNVLDRLQDRLTELETRSCRIPILWTALDPEGVGKLNEKAVRRIEQALAALPPGTSALGVVLNPSHAVAEVFLNDPTIFAERMRLFCSAVAQRFPQICEWEIWNEPNASDFYLSVREGKNIRPWTPDEFVEHVLLPGAKGIKEVQPAATLCIAGLAEDGIVGHEDREPALSNRLPHKPDYEKHRISGPYGHFYFIPNYWDELSVILSNKKSEIFNYFDACAFHPYPYFKIHQRDDKTLFSATLRHTEDFLERVESTGLQKLEVWVTEFGGRSLVVAGQHYEDEQQQADYAQEVFDYLSKTERISRAYWYKLVDMPWDLQQEKTFGLLNHRLVPRSAYFKVKSLAQNHHKNLPRRAVLDTMQFARNRGGSGLDPAVWSVTSDTIFGYSLGTAVDSGDGEILMVPGRTAGNEIRAKCKVSIDAPQKDWVRFQIRGGLSHGSGPCDLELQVHQTGKTDLVVTASLGEDCLIKLAYQGNICHSSVPLMEYPFATGGNLTGLDILWSVDGLGVELHFGEIRLLYTFEIDQPAPNESISFSLVSRKGSRKPAFLSLSRIDARLISPISSIKMNPKNGPDEINTWFVKLPRFSQICQDDWILQMLRFKRGGFFAEIGGHDGIENSNSLVLERIFGWRGMIVEANPRWHSVICRNRTATAYNNAAFSESGRNLEFVDAGAIGGLIDHLQEDIHAQSRKNAVDSGRVINVIGLRADEMFISAAAPDIIDYVSIDTEGSEAEVLRGIDFSRWRIALLTVEHGGVEANREAVWKILEPLGYLRHRVWFEDWFWHPYHFAQSLGITLDEAKAHANSVFKRERYHRRGHLIARGSKFREQGRFDVAATFFEEASKDFHPDNVHPLADAIDCHARAGQHERSLRLCDVALKAFPSNRRILRQSALRYIANNKRNRLMNVLDRIRKHCPELLDDPLVQIGMSDSKIN